MPFNINVTTTITIPIHKRAIENIEISIQRIWNKRNNTSPTIKKKNPPAMNMNPAPRYFLNLVSNVLSIQSKNLPNTPRRITLSRSYAAKTRTLLHNLNFFISILWENASLILVSVLQDKNLFYEATPNLKTNNQNRENETLGNRLLNYIQSLYTTFLFRAISPAFNRRTKQGEMAN